MASKRSSSSSVVSGSPPSKRAKKEAEFERARKSIAGFTDRFQSLSNKNLKEPNSEWKRLSDWGLDVGKNMEFFDSGNAVPKPPTFSNRYYGT